MKIIFCDIDGVLNSAYYTASHGGGVSFVEERKVKNLKKIMDATGAVLVISSRANAMFGKQFDEDRVQGVKDFGVNPMASITDIEFLESKATAIQRWLRRNNLEDAEYIVIDDCADNLEQEFRERFIHIRGKNGLTPKYVKMAIEALNK